MGRCLCYVHSIVRYRVGADLQKTKHPGLTNTGQDGSAPVLLVGLLYKHDRYCSIQILYV